MVMYNSFTFVFNDPKIQNEFEEHLGSKPIDQGVLKGQLIYNLLSAPYIVCYHYYHHVTMEQDYVPASFIFFFTVLIVHGTFFTSYALEPNFTSENIIDEDQRKKNGKRRMLAIDIFIIASLCACGLVMHAHLPLVAYTGFFRFDDGELALEPFIISCFLNIYHHNLFPVHWWVIVVTWFLHLFLILYSWLPFVMTQNVNHFQSTAILLMFYVAMLICNYRIHEGKIIEFLLLESFSMNLNSSKPFSISTVEGAIGSSTVEASNAVSNVSISRVHRRLRRHDIALIDDTNTATSAIADGRTPTPSLLPEQRKPHRSSLAKERPLY